MAFLFLKILDLIMEYGRPMQFVEDSKTSCNLLIKAGVFGGFLIIVMSKCFMNGQSIVADPG